MLVVLCWGLKKSDGTPLFDVANEAWMAQPIEVRKPLWEHFIAKIKHRTDLLQLEKRPRPAEWKIGDCTDWLEEHPLQDPACIKFLQKEVDRVMKIIEEVMEVKKQEKQANGGSWFGNLPWLHLIHCIVDDNICPQYSKRDQVASRPELDAASSLNKPPSVYGQLACKWNDKNFNPFTVRSDCHNDFAVPIDIGWEAVVEKGGYSIPSDKSIHHCLTNMCSKLLYIIKNWEHSRQDEGSIGDEQGSQLGQLENCSAKALHLYCNFLNIP